MLICDLLRLAPFCPAPWIKPKLFLHPCVSSSTLCVLCFAHSPCVHFATFLLLEQREDLASFPVRDKPCDRERPRRGVHLQQGEIGEQSPFLSQGVDPSPNVLQRIQIKYVEDGEGIRKYFAAYLLLDNFPAAFVVDDFAEFFSERSCQRRYGNTRARDLAVVHILALCQKAIAHANAKLGTLGSCNLLLSDVHLGDTPRSLFIYKRWISSIYTIQGDALGARILRTQEHWQFTK